jgi:hypothetical protein
MIGDIDMAFNIVSVGTTEEAKKKLLNGVGHTKVDSKTKTPTPVKGKVIKKGKK